MITDKKPAPPYRVPGIAMSKIVQMRYSIPRLPEEAIQATIENPATSRQTVVTPIT
jgi:hypothetical protein